MTEISNTAHPSSQELHLRQEIMSRRGATYPESLDPRGLLNPALMKDGLKAAERLAYAILHNQTIVGVADFDCDGACGAAALSRGIQMLSKAVSRSPRLEIVIPDRFHYGYGLSVALAEDQLAPLLPDVVITVDNGISSADAVVRMNQWQSAPATIITDHHQPGATLPPAFALVNPAQPDCPFPSTALCGAGVIFNLLLLVRRALARLAPESCRDAIRQTRLNRLVEFVAIATIGDVVPLDANNRLLIRQGLARMNQGWSMNARESHSEGYLSYGVRRLLELAEVSTPITTEDLAFKVVPQLNGQGRLEKPRAGLACLLADNRIMANLEAEHCYRANQERKVIQAGMEQEADALMAELAAGGHVGADGEGVPSVVLHDDDWHPGLVGLVAGRIKDRTLGAVICFAPDGDPSEGGPVSNRLKGSGRSHNVHLTETLTLVAGWAPELGIQFGGHARAAGLSLDRAHLSRFRELFDRAVTRQLQIASLENPDWHDGRLPAELRTLGFAQWIESQPWGQMFPSPAFEGHFTVEHVRMMAGRHLRLRVRDRHEVDRRGGFELVWFHAMRPGENAPLAVGDEVDLDYRLTINRWNGSVRLQGVVVGWSRERIARSRAVRLVADASRPAAAVPETFEAPVSPSSTAPVAEPAPGAASTGHGFVRPEASSGTFGFASAGQPAPSGGSTQVFDKGPAADVDQSREEGISGSATIARELDRVRDHGQVAGEKVRADAGGPAGKIRELWQWSHRLSARRIRLRWRAVIRTS